MTLAVAVNAAFMTVEPEYHFYSAQGSYLGPARIDRSFHCHIRKMRDTKSFANRIVELSQKHGSGRNRACMIRLADFQIPETAMLKF